MIEYVKIALKNLAFQKMRALLTLMGVIIGIMAVVSMISIGAGMQGAIEKSLETLGQDKIIVAPKSTYGVVGGGFTEADSDAIENIIGVKTVSPMVSVQTNIEFKGEEKTATVWGLDPEKAEETFAGASGYIAQEGRWLNKGDRGKINIGFTLHDDFFQRKVNVGNTIKIKGEDFKVIGIFDKTGDQQSDSVIYADLDQVQELFDKGDGITTIIVKINPGADPVKVSLRIENLLEKRHDKKDFLILTPQQIAEQIGSALAIVQVVFGGLAAVSLIVGGIGIANTMIMNVMERTKEIGIMKATGATHSHIVKLFLIEAGVIGLVGGSIGIILGYGISKIINVAAATYLGEGILTTLVSPELALFALGFAFIVGVISGIYPAYRAAQLDPVASLRG